MQDVGAAEMGDKIALSSGHDFGAVATFPEFRSQIVSPDPRSALGEGDDVDFLLGVHKVNKVIKLIRPGTQG